MELSRSCQLWIMGILFTYSSRFKVSQLLQFDCPPRYHLDISLHLCSYTLFLPHCIGLEVFLVIFKLTYRCFDYSISNQELIGLTNSTLSLGINPSPIPNEFHQANQAFHLIGQSSFLPLPPLFWPSFPSFAYLPTPESTLPKPSSLPSYIRHCFLPHHLTTWPSCDLTNCVLPVGN